MYRAEQMAKRRRRGTWEKQNLNVAQMHNAKCEIKVEEELQELRLVDNIIWVGYGLYTRLFLSCVQDSSQVKTSQELYDAKVSQEPNVEEHPYTKKPCGDKTYAERVEYKWYTQLKTKTHKYAKRK
jgi:hypothetical protein